MSEIDIDLWKTRYESIFTKWASTSNTITIEHISSTRVDGIARTHRTTATGSPYTKGLKFPVEQAVDFTDVGRFKDATDVLYVPADTNVATGNTLTFNSSEFEVLNVRDYPAQETQRIFREVIMKSRTAIE